MKLIETYTDTGADTDARTLPAAGHAEVRIVAASPEAARAPQAVRSDMPRMAQ